MTVTTDKITGHILAAFTIIIWGTTFIASKIMLRDFSPVQVMILRFFIAYLVLWILNHKIQKTSLREEMGFLLLAITGTTIYFLFENKALTITNTSNVSILLSVAPVFTVILAHIFTRDEKINRYVILGAIIAFLGVAMVVFNGTIMLKLSPAGDVLSIGAALSWAVYSIILKKYVGRYDSIYLTRKVVFYSIITTLPILFAENASFPLQDLKNSTMIGCLLFLGVLGSGICYVTWNMAVGRLGIVATNNYIYLSPFITMVAGKLILDEHISIMGIAGAVLIIAGVAAAGLRNNVKNQQINSTG
ncbi:DMT family transporter [Parasporobacterium paucivorans]|uniref:Permease of the drug/metabolite transporter (DMT) superfamily n=1 Tax=Parasporobacterium paucivorans DSM 15970 TaxID=1122934 RepID=A0A1M6AAU2_9FIRM|nr:DMT family transporter [Parasporobacterium paucivorans]SHI33293.1 Permease of the drug/metabolite transporter (DMT) superfamily [Parasporobacterium paucivorans DSM 15970]